MNVRKKSVAIFGLCCLFLVVWFIRSKVGYQDHLDGNISATYGVAQSELIWKNSRYLTEHIEIGTDKKVVLNLLGPPMNSEDDPIWFYPKWKPGERMTPSFYCIILNGKVVEPIQKVVAVNFEDYRHLSILNETEYNRMMVTVKKYGL